MAECPTENLLRCAIARLGVDHHTHSIVDLSMISVLDEASYTRSNLARYQHFVILIEFCPIR
jgi:hypothetical protein